MKQRTLVITVTLLIGLLAVLVVLLSQLRHSAAAAPSRWPPRLLRPCTPASVFIDQQVFTDDDLPTVATALDESWRAGGWTTQLDVGADGQAAYLNGQRGGQKCQAALQQEEGRVHLLMHGVVACESDVPHDAAQDRTGLALVSAETPVGSE